MMHTTFPSLTIVLLALVPSLPAQRAPATPEATRAVTSLVVSAPDQPPQAAVSISYGQPVWRLEYDTALPLPASNYMRLGVGWWTTLDTIGPIEIGGVRIEAGSYFLGLATAADGAFSLQVFDSRQTMKARLLSASSALYRGEGKPEAKAPLTFAKGALPEAATKLQIELAAAAGADPTAATLSIRWGKHQLSAAVRLHLDAGKAPTGGAK